MRINVAGSPSIHRDSEKVTLDYGGFTISMTHEEAYDLASRLSGPLKVERVENLRELNDKPSGTYLWNDFKVCHMQFPTEKFGAKWLQRIINAQGVTHSERFFSASQNSVFSRIFYGTHWSDWARVGGAA